MFDALIKITSIVLFVVGGILLKLEIAPKIAPKTILFGETLAMFGYLLLLAGYVTK